MRKEVQEEIRQTFQLPSGELSKVIVKAIVDGSIDRCPSIPAEYKSRVEEISDDYKKRCEMTSNDGHSRTYPLYLIIKDRYPMFRFSENGGQLQPESYFEGTRPALLSLLLDLVPPEQLTDGAVAPNGSLGKQFLRNISACEKAFQEEGIEVPSGANRARFVEWIRRGIRGEPLCVVSPVCPDYEIERSTAGQARFTFNGLNGGIGLAAERIFKVLPRVRSLAKRYAQTAGTFHVCVADYEGFSAENLRRLSITAAQFEEKLGEQLQALHKFSPVPISTPTISSLCGGREGWLNQLQDMRARFSRGEFDLHIKRYQLKDVALSRMSLYRRWLQIKDVPETLASAMIVNTASEYATIGRVAAGFFKNPLILSADHIRLAPFLVAAVPVPILNMNHIND